MVAVAPPEAADKIAHQAETEFDYAADNGLVRVRIVPEGGRLTAVISAIRRGSEEVVVDGAPTAAEITAVRPATKAAASAPRASVIAAAPMVESPVASPGELPGEFASSEFQAAEQKRGK